MTLFFATSSMEHQPDIGAFLKSVKSKLTSDSVVHVSVPNLDRILEMDCVYEFVVDHLVYFSKDTLSLAAFHEWHGSAEAILKEQ